MRTIHFVTNRPPVTGGFGPPPPCGADETLTFGAVPVQPSPDPAKPGHLTGPFATQGAVACAVAGPDIPLVAFLNRLIAQAATAGQTPIVMVHGYSYSFQDAVIRTADVATWLELGDFPVDLAPILFTWPSVTGITSDNYLADRQRAEASANALSRFILAFAAAWRTAGQPRCHVLAHSMGNWVAQSGMRALAAIQGTNLPPDLFEQAILLGADTDVTALEPGQGLDQLARIAETLTVGVNRTDFVTGVTATDILKRPRLGAAGPASIARIPDNARIVDYTIAIAADRADMPPGETTWNYKLHQYYRTVATVREDLGAILSGGDPDDIEHRFPSDAMRKAGQVGIKAGRLYLCPPAPPPPTDGIPERRGN